MDTAPSPCPPASRLAALVEDRAEGSEREALARHLQDCALCHAIAAGLARAQGHAGPAARPAPPTGSLPPVSAPRSLWWVPWVTHAVLTLAVALVAWWFLGRARP